MRDPLSIRDWRMWVCMLFAVVTAKLLPDVAAALALAIGFRLGWVDHPRGRPAPPERSETR